MNETRTAGDLFFSFTSLGETKEMVNEGVEEEIAFLFQPESFSL